MLERGIILPNANFENPNPDINFDALRLKVWTTDLKCRMPATDNQFVGTNDMYAVAISQSLPDLCF